VAVVQVAPEESQEGMVVYGSRECSLTWLHPYKFIEQKETLGRKEVSSDKSSLGRQRGLHFLGLGLKIGVTNMDAVENTPFHPYGVYFQVDLYQGLV